MTLEIAFVANNPSKVILTIASEDGNVWTGNTPTPVSASDGGGISATTFGRAVALCFGEGSGRRVILSTAPGLWSTEAAFDNAVFGAVCGYSNRLFLLSTGFSGEAPPLYSCSSTDGVTWTARQPLNIRSSCQPALAVFNGALFMVYTNENNNFMVASSQDGENWSASLQLNESTNFSPALTAHNGELCVVFVAANPSGDVLICRSTDGRFWTGNQRIGQTTNGPPSTVSYNGRLYVSFIAKNSTNTLLICSSSDAQDWGQNVNTHQSTQPGWDTNKLFVRP
jgi:hypothetical protein